MDKFITVKRCVDGEVIEFERLRPGDAFVTSNDNFQQVWIAESMPEPVGAEGNWQLMARMEKTV